MSSKCLVDTYLYEVGMIAPAMLVIVVLSFMTKRVRLKTDLCNGRPGLPIPVNFLGKERNRLIIILAFGAPASSFFEMFIGTFFGISTSTTSKIPDTPYGRAFQGLLMSLLYGIINYPYMACLNANYRIIGYVMGFLYTFIRCIVDVVMIFTCEPPTVDFLIATIFLYLPSVVCTILLVGTYGIFLYQEIRKIYARNTHPTCWEIFIINEGSDEPVAEDIDRTHVSLLLANKLFSTRVQAENEPWYVKIRRKIYQTRPDFKFSTQFLSAVFVSFIFTYQIAVTFIFVLAMYKKLFESIQRPAETLLYRLVIDYSLVAIIVAFFIAVLQLLMLIKSHRSDVLKTYRTRLGQLQGESTNPKVLVGKCLRFCGYQIAFTSIGMFFVAISVFFLEVPILLLKFIDETMGRSAVLELVKNVILGVLPLVLVPFLIWLALLLLCKFVFCDRTYPDLTVTIDNRRLFDIMSYFFFFLNILVGIWSGLLRIAKGAALGLIFLCRLDRTFLMTGYRKWDRGYVAYIGFLNVLVAFRHPVMLCFSQVLIDERKKGCSGLATKNERPRVSTKALNRWFLAAFLIKNPSLLRYRKRDSFGSKNTHSSTAVDMSTVVLEEKQMPF